MLVIVSSEKSKFTTLITTSVITSSASVTASEVSSSTNLPSESYCCQCILLKQSCRFCILTTCLGFWDNTRSRQTLLFHTALFLSSHWHISCIHSHNNRKAWSKTAKLLFPLKNSGHTFTWIFHDVIKVPRPRLQAIYSNKILVKLHIS